MRPERSSHIFNNTNVLKSNKFAGRGSVFSVTCFCTKNTPATTPLKKINYAFLNLYYMCCFAIKITSVFDAMFDLKKKYFFFF